MKQIVVQPQAVGFCRFHQRIDDCTRLRTLGCIGKEPPLPANDKRADGVFNLVVADFNLTMLKKRTEVRPATRTLCVLNFVVAAYPSVIRTPLNPSRKSEHGIIERLQDMDKKEPTSPPVQMEFLKKLMGAIQKLSLPKNPPSMEKTVDWTISQLAKQITMSAETRKAYKRAFMMSLHDNGKAQGKK